MQKLFGDGWLFVTEFFRNRHRANLLFLSEGIPQKPYSEELDKTTQTVT
jgi:hypothetical protein